MQINCITFRELHAYKSKYRPLGLHVLREGYVIIRPDLSCISMTILKHTENLLISSYVQSENETWRSEGQW